MSLQDEQMRIKQGLKDNIKLSNEVREPSADSAELMKYGPSDV